MGIAPFPSGLRSDWVEARLGVFTFIVMLVDPEFAATTAGENSTVPVGGSPSALRLSAPAIIAPPTGDTTSENSAEPPGLTVGGAPALPAATAMLKSSMVSIIEILRDNW